MHPSLLVTIASLLFTAIVAAQRPHSDELAKPRLQMDVYARNLPRLAWVTSRSVSLPTLRQL